MISERRLTPEEVRRQFPSLSSGFAYLENAGGSQVPASVPEAIARHMTSDYVQLGAGYAQSVRATELVDEAHRFAARLVNAEGTGQVILGSSTTALIHTIAKAYLQVLKPGDEIVIAESNHEANAGAWESLREYGMKVKVWPVSRESFICEIESLRSLLTEKTRIVTMPHVSNLVGKMENVKEACHLAHRVGAHVVVDGVAYAPHRAIDVQDLDADWYVFSAYKVYGPHLGVLYGRRDIFDRLTGPNHFFIPNDSAYKWELGGVSHEACAGLLGVERYLGFLCGIEGKSRRTVTDAFLEMERLEAPIEARLRDGLANRKDLDLIGPTSASENSVPTVSFVHRKVASDELVRRVHRHPVGIRNGNMYAVRLLDALGIPRDPGVVRVSAVHYNSLEEIDRLLVALDEACG